MITIKEVSPTMTENIQACRQLEASDLEISVQADSLKDQIIALKRASTQISQKKSAEEIRKSLRFFSSHLLQHLCAEEAVLFPFLKRHVPRLEYTLHLLESEHRDFERLIDKIQQDVSVFMQSDLSNRLHSILVDRICTNGSYFVYLLRHHTEVESRSLHDVVQHELKFEEQQILELQLKNYARTRFEQTRIQHA